MSIQYSNSLKKKLCEDICLNGKSTSISSNEYKIPLKTLEKWITAFNKNPKCFDSSEVNDFKVINNVHKNSYDNLDSGELKKVLMKKDIEIARLKKGYTVKEGGTDQKVFITLFKKNLK